MVFPFSKLPRAGGKGGIWLNNYCNWSFLLCIPLDPELSISRIALALRQHEKGIQLSGLTSSESSIMDLFPLDVCFREIFGEFDLVCLSRFNSHRGEITFT